MTRTPNSTVWGIGRALIGLNLLTPATPAAQGSLPAA